jgi:hypothetical protein
LARVITSTSQTPQLSHERGSFFFRRMTYTRFMPQFVPLAFVRTQIYDRRGCMTCVSTASEARFRDAESQGLCIFEAHKCPATHDMQNSFLLSRIMYSTRGERPPQTMAIIRYHCIRRPSQNKLFSRPRRAAYSESELSPPPFARQLGTKRAHFALPQRETVGKPKI